jgi:hypothetical protein
VVYLHGSGGSLLGDGNELRQLAEMGLATVEMEYEQEAEDGRRKTEASGQKSEDRGGEGQFTAPLLKPGWGKRWRCSPRSSCGGRL